MKICSRAPLIGEDPWDRTLPACTRFPDPGSTQLACPINRETSCTQDACGPRRPQLMDHARIFIGDTKTQRNAKYLARRARILVYGAGKMRAQLFFILNSVGHAC